MQMHESGTDLATIRSRIEAKYAPTFGTMTPTAPVPQGDR
jgi:hypothetical protein